MLTFFSMAWAEMRMILTTILFSFDMEILETDTDWSERQRSYLVWARDDIPLMVNMHPRK